MINRLIEPGSGHIFINNEDITKENPEILRRNIGYVIQETGLFPHYTVVENISIVPRLLKWEQQKIDERIHQLLKLIEMPASEFQNRYPHELSGGQQQRVGLARALAADPPVVLLDEPFGALDPITRKQMQTEFKKIEDQLNKTMVLVTHDVFEAFDLCDRILLMDQGKLQQIGTPSELLFHPVNEITRHFFDTNRFLLELKVTKLSDIIPYLSLKSQSPIPDSALTITSDLSLLDVMEYAGHKESKQIHLKSEDISGNKSFSLSRDHLFKAFYSLKSDKTKL